MAVFNQDHEKYLANIGKTSKDKCIYLHSQCLDWRLLKRVKVLLWQRLKEVRRKQCLQAYMRNTSREELTFLFP